PRLGEHLPEGLKLTVIDHSGQTFLEISAGIHDNALQAQPFSGHAGEQFTLAVILGDVSFRERFVV
ncbi:MAG: DUF1822 family protein, partial [Cyanothece sp. SIO1E1]|nr:DUF1822 family protein [Cyanothece sp. SIO1E1]